MNTTQITLTGDDPDDHDDHDHDDDHDETLAERESSSSDNRMNLAPADERGGEGCCPWCLSAPETFEQYGDGRPRCGFCDAAIPIDTDWYQRGEKIVL